MENVEVCTVKDPFPIVVLERDNQFYCVVKEFSILERGGDLAQAYEKAKLRKIKTLEQFKQADLEFLIQPPNPKIEKKKRLNLSFHFILLALLLMVPLASITLPLGRVLKRVSHIFQSPVDWMIAIGNQLDAMPDEKQQEFKKSIQGLMANFQPETEKNSKLSGKIHPSENPI